MHPVAKRILLHGLLTAGLLAIIGFGFSQLASIWIAGQEVRSGDSNTIEPVTERLSSRLPMMMAFWGFVFVFVGEVIIWRVRGSKKPAEMQKSAGPQPDDAEQLLNDLLAQAEAKMAADAAIEENLRRDPPAN